MNLAGEARILWSLVRGAGKSPCQRERLERFYALQADQYDRYREHLLHGRKELISLLQIPTGSHIAEVGGGTGRNLEFFGERLNTFARVDLVDFCPSLLTQANRRIQRHGWTNVQTIDADATKDWGDGSMLDAVYCSYSLTMIPDWFCALERIVQRLRPGGILGVVDFHLSRKHAPKDRDRMNACGRIFWRTFFGHDDVVLSHDHLAWLERHLTTVHRSEHRGPLPWLPFLRAPYYIFIGRKTES